jgi:methionine-rich copper-binding protein CopC
VNQDATPEAFCLSYVFTATNAPLSVSFAGASGNTGASFHLSGFSVQTAIPSGQPALTTLNPADNATGVAVGANLVATFNENVALGTGDITLKNLTDGTQTTIAVTDTTQVSISGAVLTINPTADLLAGKNYAIQIAATAIDDTAGNSFAGISDDTTWNFATLTSSSGSILFADNFDRANSTDLNASTSGKSGTLGALNWVQKVGSGGSSSISGNQLSGLGSTSGFSMSYIDHNFTDALISNGGGFSISIDLENYTTSGTVRHLGIAVGMSKAEAEGWAHNNPTSFTYADLFVGYRGNQSAIQVYDNGTRVINNTNAGAASTLPKTLKIDFALSGFNVGSTVNYTVTFGGVEMGTGSFAWTGTNENYIGVYSNLNGTGLFDDFAVSSMGGDSSPPEISSLSPTNNATGVAVGANLVATFSEVVAIATDNITIKNLTDATQTTIPVTDTTQVSISGATLTINPTANLLNGKNYAVQIAATAIDDTAGNSFVGFTNNTSWNFTTAPDTTAPTPDPLIFATPPAALGQTSITMTAATATDPSGVEYFFECTTGGGHSSAWQDSPTYTDTGLTAATQYSYKVRARDKSTAQTATAWSAAASATTANTPYGTWSGGAAFDGDANNDGVANGMAWLLGVGDPTENAAGKLPKATRNGTNLRLTFRCLKSTKRGGTPLKVQSSADLGITDPWTNHEAAVPDADATVNGVVFDITDDGDHIHVIADIPVGGTRLFGRLSAVNAP